MVGSYAEAAHQYAERTHAAIFKALNPLETKVDLMGVGEDGVAVQTVKVNLTAASTAVEELHNTIKAQVAELNKSAGVLEVGLQYLKQLHCQAIDFFSFSPRSLLLFFFPLSYFHTLVYAWRQTPRLGVPLPPSIIEHPFNISFDSSRFSAGRSKRYGWRRRPSGVPTKPALAQRCVRMHTMAPCSAYILYRVLIIQMLSQL